MNDSFTIVDDYTRIQRRIFANRTAAEEWVRSQWDIAGTQSLGNDTVDFLTERYDEPVARITPARFDELFPRCQRDHGQVI